MASYSGRFISNLERNDYVGSGSDKCKLRDDRFTHNDVKSRNREDNCLVSVDGNVYDITSATKQGVIYPPLDPAIFEIKYLNRDIKGKVVNF